MKSAAVFFFREISRNKKTELALLFVREIREKNAKKPKEKNAKKYFRLNSTK